MLLSCTVLSCASATAGQRLDAEQLGAFYTDQTVVGVHHKLGLGRTHYAGDGTVRSRAENGNERVGKWWIDTAQGMRCVRWNGENRDLCHYTEDNGDGTHVLVHGKNGRRLVEIKQRLAGDLR